VAQAATLEKVITVIAGFVENMDESEISADHGLEADLGVDSLAVAEIIMELEEVFEDLEIDEENVENVKTVGDVAQMVDNLLA
jgi:acyl carrier protein